MLATILKKILGTKNERDLKRIHSRIEAINGCEAGIARLTDAELQARTDTFKRLIRERTEGIEDAAELRGVEKTVLEELLPEAFAVVREASKRTLGMRHFEPAKVQVLLAPNPQTPAQFRYRPRRAGNPGGKDGGNRATDSTERQNVT